MSEVKMIRLVSTNRGIPASLKSFKTINVQSDERQKTSQHLVKIQTDSLSRKTLNLPARTDRRKSDTSTDWSRICLR